MSKHGRLRGFDCNFIVYTDREGLAGAMSWEGNTVGRRLVNSDQGVVIHAWRFLSCVCVVLCFRLCVTKFCER